MQRGWGYDPATTQPPPPQGRNIWKRRSVPHQEEVTFGGRRWTPGRQLADFCGEGWRIRERLYDDNGNWRTRTMGEQRERPALETPTTSTYIPPPLPEENVEDIFRMGCTSGIYFNRYEAIPVKTSGENPPPPITTFQESGLNQYLLDVIDKCRYKRLTPIQKHAMPVIMAGRDLMGCAQTGSGKTAAFLLPIINNLVEDDPQVVVTSSYIEPQVIVMSPTRELAIQIFDEARKFSYGSALHIGIVYGGTAVGPQLGTLMTGCHILVATPGRLDYFIETGKIRLRSVRFLVLDEADRMLDMGFLRVMKRVMEMTLGGDRQTLMFSATFPLQIQRLAGEFLNNYIFIAVGIIGAACMDVEQKFYRVSKFDKRGKLVELLKEKGSAKTLVFVQQKRTAVVIANFLSEKNFSTTAIHGDREQNEREEALRDFKRGQTDILVATAVAARGLDIRNVAHVINFEIPKSIDEYVHRIGRTGRVGNRGLATSFFDEKEDQGIARHLVRILCQAQQKVPDFLQNAAKGVGCGVGGGSSHFGGIDVRGHQANNESTAEEICKNGQQERPKN